jgi:hypothetical protein
MQVKFEIRQGISAFLQLFGTVGISGVDKTLKITFPDQSTLTFSDAQQSFPAMSPIEVGVFGDDDHDILADLDEWGFDMTRKVIKLDVETIREDVASIGPNQVMYLDKDGKSAGFPYNRFPSGVYKITFSTKDIAAINIEPNQLD